MPLLLKIKGGRTLRPYGYAGPEFGFVTSAAIEVDTAGVVTRLDIKEQIAPMDVGLIVGGGLEIPAGPVSLLIEGSYSRGLRATSWTCHSLLEIR